MSTLYGATAQHVNNYFQRASTLRARRGLPFADVSKRPVFYPRFGNWLKDVRERAGKKQKEVADLAARRGLRLTRQQLLHLEQGKTQHPDPEALRAIAAIYRLDLRDVLSRLIEEMYGWIPLVADATDHTPAHDVTRDEAQADPLNADSTDALLAAEKEGDGMQRMMLKWLNELPTDLLEAHFARIYEDVLKTRGAGKTEAGR